MLRLARTQPRGRGGPTSFSETSRVRHGAPPPKDFRDCSACRMKGEQRVFTCPHCTAISAEKIAEPHRALRNCTVFRAEISRIGSIPSNGFKLEWPRDGGQSD